jgi:hypothetical protein
MRNAKFRGSQVADYSTISKRQKKAVLVTCAVAIFSAALAVIIQFVYLPLGVDGALYSYPSLSLSRGGDPGESQLSVEELENIEGVKAAWGYDVSRTVRVLPVSWWFRIFGANIWTVKALGLLEMVFLFGIMYFVLQGASRDRETALLLWAIYLTDSMVLGLSTSLRPDIMVTILTLIVFMLVNTRFEDKTNHILIFFLALLSMLLLAVTHITAAISLSFLMCYMIAEIIFSWHSMTKFKKCLHISLTITGLLGFLMRRSVCAVLVPSQYLDRIGCNTVVDVEKSVYALLSGGILPLIEKEYSRWFNYFYPYNLPLLFVIFIAIFLFAANILGPSGKRPSSSQMSILIGCIGAFGVLALDPHPWAAHALALVPFFIIFLAKELNATHITRLKHIIICFLFVLAFLSAGSQVGRAGRIVMKSTQNGFSNGAFIDLMKSVFNEDRKYLVVGPTELWPYINPKTNVTIFDAKIGKMNELSRYMRKIDYFILDKDYKGYDWENRFREKYPNVALQTVAEIGKEDSGWPFVKVIKPVVQQ